MIRRLRNEIAGVLQVIGTAGPDADGLARLGMAELPRLVPSDLTTLSVCDLATGRRRVIGNPGQALSPDDIDAFDRHFFAHPLVRFHSAHPEGDTHRISDSVARRDFRENALYNEYYRRIGIEHAVALQRAAKVLRQLQEMSGTVSGAAGIGGLTPREGEILEWVAAGKSHRQIAAIVGVSPRTVQKHLEHIYVKLGVENRTAAAMRARTIP